MSEGHHALNAGAGEGVAYFRLAGVREQADRQRGAPGVRDGVGQRGDRNDVDMVKGVCDEVVVLDFGAPDLCRDSEEVRRDPAVRAAYLGDLAPEALS
jgi:hypothetical protein